MGVDDVLRLPHTLREGDSSKQLPSAPINAVSKSDDGVNPEFLHQLFNHGNPDKIHRTLGVTRGFKQPHSPLPGCHCTSCASANARRKGLSHKQYTILNIGHEDPGTDENDITDEEMPSMFSQSEDESDTYDSIDSDSDEEVIISHHGPNFNQIEEGDGSNDEPLYGDETHQVETNNCKELQDITKLEATSEGQTADQTVPRSIIGRASVLAWWGDNAKTRDPPRCSLFRPAGGILAGVEDYPPRGGSFTRRTCILSPMGG